MAIVDLSLLVHALATCLMAGLCWCVQVVHYPLMARVPFDALPRYAREHARRITWFVAPTMLVEAVTAGLLLVMAVAGQRLTHEWALEWAWVRGDWRVLVGAGLLALIWLSTFGVLVPLHTRLQGAAASEEARSVVAKLVAWNWPRTMLWTVRSVLALMLLGER
jgi:hypothetical protein